ncbi:uncharacterized protein LOC118510395 [Anopheles stephensi]|uniref:uncharacterized protein LOC118510395 n=1 Tax=Anopheles stephensi TaxID=30069 RepID=UPI0007D3A494|nr:uncharacterized protein LOC118510395 [Anopheles stephensi]
MLLGRATEEIFVVEKPQGLKKNPNEMKIITLLALCVVLLCAAVSAAPYRTASYQTRSSHSFAHASSFSSASSVSRVVQQKSPVQIVKSRNVGHHQTQSHGYAGFSRG